MKYVICVSTLNSLGLGSLIYEMRIVLSAFLTLEGVVKIK